MTKYLPLLLFGLSLFLVACEQEELQPELDLSTTEALSFETIDQGLELSPEEAQANLDQEYRRLMASTRSSGRSEVILPAGSLNGLAAAIAQAGPGGTVLLEPGDHLEDTTVVVDIPVTILGEDGANLVFTNSDPIPPTIPISVGLHVRDTEGARIQNLNLVPQDGQGGTALLIQDAPATIVLHTEILDWQFGVLVEASSRCYLGHNTVVGSNQWLSDPTFSCFGIVVINGARAIVYNNTVSNTVFGIWACDLAGYLVGNEFNGNYNGVVLCTVPPNTFPLPDGQFVGSQTSATRWAAYYNKSTGNFNNGFEVIDGANGCFLYGNTALENGAQDYEFAGETERYGFVAPTSRRNWAVILPQESTYKDCGDQNRINGGLEINTGLNPCF